MLSQGGLESQNPVLAETKPWALDNQTFPRESECQMHCAQVVRTAEAAAGGLEALKSSNNVTKASWEVTN